MGGFASDSAAIPPPDQIDLTTGPERVEIFLSLGLDREAERMLREDLASGASWARTRLLSLLVRRARYEEAESVLASWGGVDSLGTDGGRFLAACLQERLGHWKAAAAAYAGAAEREPLLSDYASFRAGVASQEIGAMDEALDRFESAGASARNQDLAALAHWRAAQLSAQRGLTDRALENLERIPPRSVIARQDLLDLEARVQRTKGNVPREIRTLRELLERAPTSEQAIRAIDRLIELGISSADDRIAFAEAALKNRHASLASDQIAIALQMLEAAPNPVKEGHARLLSGKALLSSKRFTAARKELESVGPDADPADRAEARLDGARCLWKLGQIDACLAEYDLVADGDYPSSHRETASWEAARESKDNQRWEEAALRMGEFAQTYPKSEYADDALWHQGRALSELGRSKDAIEALDRLGARYPDTPFFEEARYWIAGTYRSDGDDEAACRALVDLVHTRPDSYWASRARDVLVSRGCAPEGMEDPRLESDAFEWLAMVFPETNVAEARQANERIVQSENFRRASALADAGFIGDAETELRTLRRSLGRDVVSLLSLAEHAWQIGVPRSAMRAISELKEVTARPILSGETPASVARLLYPVDHLDSVLRWSSEYDLDPLFVFAVMREESWFDPGAISWVGARGLLQIMPATGRDLARRVGMRNFDRADLFDPDVNIQLGSFYLRSLLNELDKEPALALSAYNAGKGNALRWKKGIDGEFDVDRYVAGITYRETYNYVQKVTRSWAIYRHLYSDLVPHLRDIQSAVPIEN
jgi:soluble lytic murein transglycosylase